MPRRDDLDSILILGSGPITIGQGCEFDYSGTQACRALRACGYRIILINSNPATIMTDPDLVDATYIEPIVWDTVARVIEKEKPNALLPTMGGQTALNCALDLHHEGILKKQGVELIGATQEAIDKAEDREQFRALMQKIGLAVPRASIAHSLEEALQVQPQLGFPTIIRPSYTLGGSGGGIAYNQEEFVEICQRGLAMSPTTELLIEESLLGWKEYELEVVRDKADNCIIVCGIENFDPMGVHTGDSITIAPQQTLTDKEYQAMRDDAIKVVRAIGVDTGGANVQFAVDAKTGRQVVIEMNPRVSRSSALASKATGFPIAKVAALLAVGFTLDELKNEMTSGKTPIAFEPTIDYVVSKIPRFNFDKFPQVKARLTTQMKSVGEVMAISPTFGESIQKALCSLELGLSGFDSQWDLSEKDARQKIEYELQHPGPLRILFVADGFRLGLSVDEIYQLTKIDPWFLQQIKIIVEHERDIKDGGLLRLSKEKLAQWKRRGFSDKRLATLLEVPETTVRKFRELSGIAASFRRIDSCAAEFPTETAYLYSTYEACCEAQVTGQEKVLVIGSGPNRIGQGVEFDYCCVQSVQTLSVMGFEAIMVNCNPETVSTDSDISDRLYFEPITLEHLLNIIAIEKPKAVVIQFGGQTPLKLSQDLHKAGVKILGTTSDAIDCAEDRSRFGALITELGLQQPQCESICDIRAGLLAGEKLGFPLMVRPSYVLGGQSMEIVQDMSELNKYLTKAIEVAHTTPILLDRYLEGIEVDVDAVVDQTGAVFVAGIMEHIEQSGIHSGDSACSLPPFSFGAELEEEIKKQVIKLANGMDVVGLFNVQFVVIGKDCYVLEVNPRASRTVPFVSKAIGIPLSRVATRCMLGQSLAEQGVCEKGRRLGYYSVKYPVFPFIKFPGADPILGPQMRSTGEVMGIAPIFATAYSKGLKAVGLRCPTLGGRVLLSVCNEDKSDLLSIAKSFIELGFELIATRGTAKVLTAQGMACRQVNKMAEGRPHIVDMIKNREIDFIVNTTQGKQSIADSRKIRSTALEGGVNYTTTLAGAKAMIMAMHEQAVEQVNNLQFLYKEERVVDYA